MNEARRMLERAADQIEEFGWMQGKLGSCETGFCVMGAMDQVFEEMERDGIDFADAYHIYIKAERLLASQVGTPAIVGWNDSPHRTKEQVIAALREAAKETS